MNETTPRERVLEIGQAMDEAALIAEQAEKHELIHGAEMAAASKYTVERDEMNRLFGQVQMARSLAKFADVVSLAKLEYIKKTKLYQSLNGKLVELPGGETADVSSWAGFCKALGTSHQKVDEDLRNLAAFGEEALENLNRIGAGYRELRRLRRLPADDQQAVLESDAAMGGDKEELQDLIEKFEERLNKKTMQADGLAKDLAANKALLEKKQERINELDRQLSRREAITPDERESELEKAMNSAVQQAIGGLLEPAAAAQAIFDWDDAPENLRLAAMHGFERISASLRDIGARLGIPDMSGGGLIQDWMQEGNDHQLN